MTMTLDTKSAIVLTHLLILKLLCINQYPSSNSLFPVDFMIFFSFYCPAKSKAMKHSSCDSTLEYICFSGIGFAFLKPQWQSSNLSVWVQLLSPAFFLSSSWEWYLVLRKYKVCHWLCSSACPSCSDHSVTLSSLLPLSPFPIFLTLKPV